MRRRGNEHTAFRDLAFLISGIGIGSGIALLLAPSSGEDLRYAIGRGCRRTAKQLGRRTDELRDRAEDFLDHARDIRDRGSKLLQRA
jgi:gas vesicle protein